MRFTVIGISDTSTPDFSDEMRGLIARHSVFSGGLRHRDIVRRWLPPGHTWIKIAPPMASLYEEYRRVGGDIVVFASGDPLFNGIAVTLQREFPDAALEVYPTFNSLQMLCHRMLLPYQSMRVVSLTGRSWHAFDAALIEGSKMVGVLTDSEIHTPETIAVRMLRYGYDNYTMVVGECLGNAARERTGEYSLEEVSKKSFIQPNCLVLRQQRVRCRPSGVDDSRFLLLDGRTTMLTKRLLRMLSLAQLDLHNRHVLWDVGFCTGSVSIEARLQYPHLEVVAFERRSECKALIEGNAIREGVPGIMVAMGDFLQQELVDFPAPDAVFIGGHGGRLPDVLRAVSQRLCAGGVVVFNSVSAESCMAFTEALGSCDLRLEEKHAVQLDEYNPITILKAVRCNG